MIASPPPLLEFDTAVIILLVAGLLWLSKAFIDLKARVARLESGPAAASPGAASAKPESQAAPVSAVTANVPAPATVVTDASSGVPPEVRAAIAAAVYLVAGKHTRIVSVSPASNLIWSREGRRAVFDSHRVR